MEEKHTAVPIMQAIEGVEALGYRMMFLHRGVLQHRERFDVERHHTQAVHRADYVFNFVFLPTS